MALYHFGGPAYDGLNPYNGLLQGSDSYLYGTTFLGGTNGAGSLFKIGPAGGLIYLYAFDAFIGDGVHPEDSLVEGYDVNYYGTTYQGGTNGFGMVYKLAYPLPGNPNEPNITDSGNSGATNNFVFSFAGVAGETYQLQFADVLPAAIWSNAPGVVISNATGGPLLFSNLVSTTVPQRFYRLQITP